MRWVRCDRCYKIIAYGDSKEVSNVYVVGIPELAHHQYDLCDDCKNEFLEWLGVDNAERQNDEGRSGTG